MKSRILIGFALNGQGRSGLSLRAARIGLLALALALAGVLLWPAPTPAEAQSQTVQLWSVSFSASDVGGNVVGCDSGSGAALQQHYRAPRTLSHMAGWPTSF